MRVSEIERSKLSQCIFENADGGAIKYWDVMDDMMQWEVISMREVNGGIVTRIVPTKRDAKEIAMILAKSYSTKSMNIMDVATAMDVQHIKAMAWIASLSYYGLIKKIKFDKKVYLKLN